MSELVNHSSRVRSDVSFHDIVDRFFPIKIESPLLVEIEFDLFDAYELDLRTGSVVTALKLKKKFK